MRSHFRSLITTPLLVLLNLSIIFTGNCLVITRTLAQSENNQTQQSEAIQLLNKGIEQYRNGQYQNALETYQQVLEIYRKTGDKKGESTSLQLIGAVYNNLAQYAQAIQFYQEALAIYREINDQTGEASILNSLGGAYQQQGQYSQAVEFYQQSLTIRSRIKDRIGEGQTLNNLGSLYYNQGQYAQALKTYQQALVILRVLNNIKGVGATLNNIGLVYSELGQYSQALKVYHQTLEIRQKIRDLEGVGATLHNIGFAHARMKQPTQAVEFYQQALAIRTQIGDKAGKAKTLNNLGFIHNEIGQQSQALKYLNDALLIGREIGDRAGESYTLDSIGTVYKELSEYSKALEFYQQALAIKQEIGDRTGERITLSNIASLLEKQNQPELAIIFYKQSINLTEAIRKDLKILPRIQQQSYTQTVADTYRSLADLLLKRNRVLEAQKVLDLLKLQEIDDYLRNSNIRGNQPTDREIELLPPERQIQDNIATIQEKAVLLGKELSQLRQILPNHRTPAQTQRIAELEQIQQQIRQRFNEFILRPEVATTAQQLYRTTGSESLDLLQLNRLQRPLQQLNRSPVLLYPLILEDRLELVLVTPYAPPIHRTVPVTQEELNRAIVEFRRALVHPTTRSNLKAVQKPARQLYSWLIQPIENELAQAGTKTIIYAPDGQLRYIPLAALYDGNRWLVERFDINNITAASLINFNPQLSKQPRVLAAAFTQGSYEFLVGKARYAFAGLEFAGQEVEKIATILPGTTMLLDRAFSRETTVPQLNDHSIVHFATHAAFVSGQPEESFILFGNGDRVTLRDIQTWNLTNVDLVVLSACQTGVGGILGNGEEILGLGYQMQQAGALATIASLWVVDDEGTQVLMDAFYAALQQKSPKTQALQKAQIALINSKYNHPYYWAPFIMIGNGF
jgi:CHAT domain-containing protein/Tfp pilus assembly protein PilF